MQDDRDRQRLSAGGDPWYVGLPRACIGPGLYCWSTLGEAEAYRDRLAGQLGAIVHVLRYTIGTDDFDRLRSLDLTTCTPDELDAWSEVHSEYTQNASAVPHHYDFVLRETNHAGKECYFSPAAFARLRSAG